MEETISLKEIFEVIRKRFLLILAFVFGAALIVSIVTFFVITPTYEAKSQFIVNQSKQDQGAQYSINDVRLNVELISTYNDIIKSPVILEDVIETLNLPYSVGSFGKKISLSSAQSSQVVTVTVTDPSPSAAAEIANTTVEVFQDKLPSLMNMNVDNVQVLSEAKVSPNPSPVAPKPTLNIAIAIVLGGMIGVGLAFLLEYLDTTISDEEDVEKYLELPILGVISRVEDKDIRDGNTTFQRTTGQRRVMDGKTQTKTS